MFCDCVIASDIFALEDVFPEKFHLTFQARWKNGKPHNLDQADIFFLDMMQICVRMVYAKRMLLCGNVVPESQIQLVQTVFHTCDRGDRVVRCAVCLGVDKCILIGVGTPFAENMVRKVNDPLRVFAAQTDN